MKGMVLFTPSCKIKKIELLTNCKVNKSIILLEEIMELEAGVKYKLTRELKNRIHLYCAFFGKFDETSLDVDEMDYLCQPHPSFLDYIEKDETN